MQHLKPNNLYRRYKSLNNNYLSEREKDHLKKEMVRKRSQENFVHEILKKFPKIINHNLNKNYEPKIKRLKKND
jgi:hypothetical protein